MLARPSIEDDKYCRLKKVDTLLAGLPDCPSNPLIEPGGRSPNAAKQEGQTGHDCHDYHTGGDFASASVGRSPYLAIQPELGLLPERRTGPCCADFGDFAPAGADLNHPLRPELGGTRLEIWRKEEQRGQI
jgi:hypothetical protein